MSEELRIMLSKELREENPQEITYNNLVNILVPLREFLLKCLINRKETCNIVLRETQEITKEIGSLRVKKALEGKEPELSFDKPFLKTITRIIKEYYNITLGVEAPYDEYNRVLVKLLRDFEHNGRILRRNNITLIESYRAVLLESLGFVKIYRIKVFK